MRCTKECSEFAAREAIHHKAQPCRPRNVAKSIAGKIHCIQEFLKHDRQADLEACFTLLHLLHFPLLPAHLPGPQKCCKRCRQQQNCPVQPPLLWWPLHVSSAVIRLARDMQAMCVSLPK